jgi:hypothetical protein
VRLALVMLAFLISAPVAGQEPPLKKKPAAKKPAASKKQVPPKAHTQATPEQIRKFNELQKKQQQQKAKL